MSNKTVNRKDTFGQAVIASLQDFLETVDRGEPITARTVKLDLKPREYGKEEVETLRLDLGVSQAIFAQLLGVSLKLVQAWERGARRPSKLACRLLDEIARDPKAWLQRQIATGTQRTSVRRTGRAASVGPTP